MTIVARRFIPRVLVPLGALAVGAAAALTLTSGPAPVPPSATDPVAASAVIVDVPACLGEDDEVGPCFWDALTQGNGRGRSFFLDSEGNAYFMLPPVGAVTTHSGRLARPGKDDQGCIFLDYAEMAGVAGDPADTPTGMDGEEFCP